MLQESVYYYLHRTTLPMPSSTHHPLLDPPGRCAWNSLKKVDCGGEMILVLPPHHFSTVFCRVFNPIALRGGAFSPHSGSTHASFAYKNPNSFPPIAVKSQSSKSSGWHGAAGFPCSLAELSTTGAAHTSSVAADCVAFPGRFEGEVATAILLSPGGASREASSTSAIPPPPPLSRFPRPMSDVFGVLHSPNRAVVSYVSSLIAPLLFLTLR